MSRLDDIRLNINTIDKQMVELFEERMNLVNEVTIEKMATGKAVYDSKREQEVIRKAILYTKDKSLNSFVKEFFESMMDISKKYQHQKMPDQTRINAAPEINCESVGFQGIAGSFSDSAVDYLYDKKVERKSYASFEALFRAVMNGEVADGVLPFENTSTGGVTDVLDLLRKYDLYIVSQFDVRIHHYLLGVKGSSINTLKYVYSHPQALMQCSRFFSDYTEIIGCPYANTAIAAYDVSTWQEVTKGAIASKKAADHYNLTVLAEKLEDNKNNTTRFITVRKELLKSEEASKTSIVFTAAHEPGALFKILKTFYDKKINITRIESRPNIERNFEYFFYVDFEGTVTEKHVMSALKIAKANCGYFKILGSYIVKGEI